MDDFAGITPVQQSLIQYWRSRQDAYGLVRREAIDPGDLRAMLACISIVEFDAAGEGRFRVAGSCLRDRFGGELRGRRVQDVAGVSGDAYLLGLTEALDSEAPVGGLTEQGGRIHAWLRLPLVGDNGRLCLVLCHDDVFETRRAFNAAMRAELTSLVPVFPRQQAA